jgi:hypothetical protein
VFGARHSLHRSFFQAKGFYASFALLVACAAGIVLIPGAPLGVITTAVQALAGVLLPSASVFLLLLCNDKEVLGPWVNKPWLNALATLIISVLLVLSLILVVTTVFSSINVPDLLAALGAVLVVGLIIAGALWLRRMSRAEPVPPEQLARRDTWRMPPLALLGRPPWSRGRVVTMWGLRVYLVIAVVLLLVKAVQLGSGVH